MLSLLSRISLGVAALAAAASLFATGTEATVLVAVAIAFLAVSWWLTRFRPAQPEEVSAPEADGLEAVALLEVLERIDRQTAGALSLEEALRCTGDILVHELGMAGATVRELLRNHDGSVPQLTRRASEEAVRTGRAAGGPRLGYSLPVRQGGQIVALLEMGDCEMPVPPTALLHLLETVRARLDALAHAHAKPLAQTAAPASPTPSPLPAAPYSASPLGDAGGLINLIVENLPMSLFVSEPGTHRVLAINRHAEIEFELDRAAVVGRRVADAFHPALAAQVVPLMEQVERTREAMDHEFEWRDDKGHEHVMRARHVLLCDAAGAPLLLITLPCDVTEERRTARRLRESETDIGEFAAGSEDTLFIADPDRNHFYFVGGRAAAGVTPDQYDAYSRELLHSVVEEDRPGMAQYLTRERLLEPVDIRFRMRHPHLGTRWMRARTRTRRRPDGSQRVYGVLSDMTREHEHEAALQRALAEAKAASEARSQFMANMSDEIRTPLNGILGMAELLLGTELSARQRGFARGVCNSGESLLEVINEILDFSRIEAGCLELVEADFVLRGVVEDTLELLAPRAHAKGLELSFLEMPGVPMAAHGDALRLRQVLGHLVANAIKFTAHGEVAVTLGPAADAAPGTVQFAVRDTGEGIDPDYLPRLFDAFSQAHADSARRHGGTGLGLAVSRRLVELMNGRIEARSQHGVGSEFIVRVPLAPARAPEAAPDDKEAAALASRRALVVDDHESSRRVLASMLAQWGVDVVLAEDGLQALDVLRADTRGFDFALVDMRMPRLDGLGLAQVMRRDEVAPATRLLLLCGASGGDDMQVAQRAGFRVFLAKPVRRAELRQALLGLVAGGDASPGPALRGQVLVIEDNLVNQEVIGQMLRQLGFTARVAGSGTLGLRALCEAHFDLVLMDIQMPGMDGVQTLSWLRRGPGGRFDFETPPSVPVVAITANALAGDEERYRALGFDDYLSKPFRQSQLLAMLDKRLPATPEAAPAPAPAQPEAAPAPDDAVPAQGVASVLDAGAIERLRELDPRGEGQLIERVVGAFETSVGRLIPQLHDAQRAGDLAGIRHVAHTLKSSSASVGAMKLSQMCAHTEAMIRQDRAENLDAAVDEISREKQDRDYKP